MSYTDKRKDNKSKLLRSLATNDIFHLWSPASIHVSNSVQKSFIQEDYTVLSRVERPNQDFDTDRHIGGTMSTEEWDRQQESVVAKGLTFDECIHFGWFNDNHAQDTSSVIGAPYLAELRLQNDALQWYCEGVVFKGYAPSDRVWNLAEVVKQAHRQLGFSVEGDIIERDGPKIVKATIRNVAITANPVNTSCTWDILCKSMTDTKDNLTKAMLAGNSVTPIGGGNVLAGNPNGKSVTLPEDRLIDWLRDLFPDMSDIHLKTLLEYTLNM